MNGAIKKGMGALMLAATLAGAATPADAQRYSYYRYGHHHHGSDAGLAIGLGILGLGIGAAIASSGPRYNRYSSDPYYNGDYRGYYGRGYDDRGYYDGGYYGDSSGYGGRRCWQERRYDTYTGRPYMMRYCD